MVLVKVGSNAGLIGGSIVIINDSNAVVIKSGRVPRILILQVPDGLVQATVIYPEDGSIEISLVAYVRETPSDKSIPLYVHVFVKVPQFTVAENGVIAKFWIADNS